MKILTVFGTRPEAIKLATLIELLSGDTSFTSKVCVTGQHREMLDQVLDTFNIPKDFDLNLMRKNQTLEELSSKILQGMNKVFNDFKPDMVLVHGDTTSTFIASLSSFYNKIPIGHVEAGLRTGNIFSPWPEEANRKLTSALSDIHFAPTDSSKSNLINEGVSPENIHVTGNTVVDTLLRTTKMIEENKLLQETLSKKFDFLNSDKKMILVTGHRRESFGEGFEKICLSLRKIALTDSSIQIVYPVHLNPNVRLPVNKNLSDVENIYLIDPQEYIPFVYLMNRSHLILTDSGGIQEEAPSLGKPILVMRDTTERPEAIKAGTAKLVGTDPDTIYDAVKTLLNDESEYKRIQTIKNPYGDGKASKRIINLLRSL